MDFKNVPYNHSGRWEKIYDSIMAPGEKCTWPQFIVEMVIYWRSRLIPDFPAITKGKGWSKSIAGQVRRLEQQAAVICNYFPHPQDEPLVVYAVKKYFRTNRITSIGGFRKNRVKVTGGKEKCLVSQAEKDVVLGIQAELDQALKLRSTYEQVKPSEPKQPHEVTFETAKRTTPKKNSVAYLLSLEKQLKTEQKSIE